jgi:hypothetical protein
LGEHFGHAHAIGFKSPSKDHIVWDATQVAGQSHLFEEVNKPLARVPVIPSPAISVVGLEGVVVIMKALAMGEQSQKGAVSGGIFA